MSPLSVLERHFGCWSIDFVTNLPLCAASNAIMVHVDWLTKFVHLTLYTLGYGEISAEIVACLFFNAVVHLLGLPDMAVHDSDPRFIAGFWKSLWSLLGP